MTRRSWKYTLLRGLWRVIPWLAIGLILGFIILLGIGIKNEQLRLAEARKTARKQEAPAVRIITLKLTPTRLEDKLSLPAEIEPYEELWVKAEVPGQVTAVVAREGQMVEKGQTLVLLDERDYRSRVAQIEANYNLARVDHARISKLVRQKIAAKSKLDETEARLNALAAQLGEARLALARTRIVAPISGRINEIRAKLGDFLSVGREVAHILQLDRVKVRVGVPESDVAAVLDLQEADVVIEALGKRRVKGRKTFLARQPRTMARLYDLELVLPNKDGKILPGMFAKVELIKAVYQHALAVPLYAVITQGEERFVYVERAGRAEKRLVRLGVLAGWQVQVLDGLRPGDRVIVVGHRLLDHGQPVEVIKNVIDPVEIGSS